MYEDDIFCVSKPGMTRLRTEVRTDADGPLSMPALAVALHGGVLSVVCRTQVKKGSLQHGGTLAWKRRAVLTDVCPVHRLPQAFMHALCKQST